MKNTLARWLKYRCVRLYIRLTTFKRAMDSYTLNEEQKNGIRIAKILAVQPSSEILMAPISDRYFIKNQEIFIVIDLNRITIINSVYHYDIYISDRTTEQLILFIRRIIEKRRNLMEKEMLSKIEKSLDHIVINLTEKFNKKGEA